VHRKQFISTNSFITSDKEDILPGLCLSVFLFLCLLAISRKTSDQIIQSDLRKHLARCTCVFGHGSHPEQP